MKKLLFLSLMMFLPIMVHAVSVEINGIYYELGSDTYQAWVIESPYYNQYSGDIDIPSTVTYEGVTYDVTGITIKAFYRCKNVTSVSIPNSITTIGSSAFEGCTFKTIAIPNSVTRIDADAFHSCTELEAITMGTGIKEIGKNAFTSCLSLKKIVIKDLASWCNIFFESRESSPFCNSPHLYSAEDTEIVELVIPNGVESINSYAFIKCKHITSLIIPNSVKIIKKEAFADCDGLTNIDVPDGVTNLSGFSYCSNLATVSIPSSVTDIGAYAFSWCQSLTSINIPNSVTWIQDYAFIGCETMKDITLGSSVKTIDVNAFYKCYNLKDVYCYAENTPSTRNKPFDETIITNVTLHVPENAIDIYKATEPWKNFKEVVAIASSGIDPINSKPITLKNKDGNLIIEGIANEDSVSVFSMDGTKIGSAISRNGVAHIYTNLQSGKIVIVKINDMAYKVIVK